MNSFNHYSFGAVGQWMMAYSLGIERDEPGFQTFILQPEPDPTGAMTWAEGYYDSMYGRISSAWKVEGDDPDLPGHRAREHDGDALPARLVGGSVKEGGKDARGATGSPSSGSRTARPSTRSSRGITSSRPRDNWITEHLPSAPHQ